MLDAGLIASRFLHYIAVLSLFGAALYPLYTFRGRLDALAREQPGSVRWLRRFLLFAATLALVSGVGWFVFTTASMADDMTQVANPAMLRTMMEETDFGPLWASRLGLTATIGALLFRWPAKFSLMLVPLLAALLLASLAGTGHTRVTAGGAGVLHILSDALHLLAAGLWLGGLWPLGMLAMAARNNRGSTLPIVEVLRRFSGIATGTVAVLVASGLINGWFLVGSVGALLRTTYGWLLLAKISLFFVMALLAIANRFWITPQLALAPSDPAPLARLRMHIVAEQTLGLLVLLLVSVLGTVALP